MCEQMQLKPNEFGMEIYEKFENKLLVQSYFSGKKLLVKKLIMEFVAFVPH